MLRDNVDFAHDGLWTSARSIDLDSVPRDRVWKSFAPLVDALQHNAIYFGVWFISHGLLIPGAPSDDAPDMHFVVVTIEGWPLKTQNEMDGLIFRDELPSWVNRLK